MKRITYLLLTALFLTAAGAGATASLATAQETPTASPATSGDDCTEHLDPVVSLCSAELRGETAVLEFDVDRRIRVLLTDATGVFDRGQVQQREVLLEDRTTVRFEVTMHEGDAAVTVDTGTTLYAIPLQDATPIVAGPFDGGELQLVGASVFVGTSGVFVWRLLSAFFGPDEYSERVA